MKTTLRIKNCYECGCRNSVHKTLSRIRGIYGVRVDPDRREITIEHTDEISENELAARLEEMGYSVTDESDPRPCKTGL